MLSLTRTGARLQALMVDLEAAPPRKLSVALTAGLRGLLRDQALPAGTRLPSSRSLAEQIGVSRGTVLEAYQQLVAEGLIDAGNRRAPRVARLPALPANYPEPPAEFVYDLHPASPDPSLFPRAVWGRHATRALKDATNADLSYGLPFGAPQLRNVLAVLLASGRATRARAEDIVVCTGFTQALALSSQVLVRRGVRRVAIEATTLPDIPEILRWAKLEPVPLPVDLDGCRVDLLDGADVQAVVLTPAHQYPVGVVLSAERRRQVLDWAHRGSRWIVEDDYDSDFRYDGRPVASLQGLDPSRVVYMGTAAKSLSPSLRLGWMIAPAELREELRYAKSISDAGSPTLGQLTLARMMSSGDYTRHIRRTRLVYRRRRDALVGALADHLPHLPPSGIAAGVHALVRLPTEVSDVDISARLFDARVRVLALSSLHHGDYSAPGLVLGYAGLPVASAERVARAIADALADR